MLIQLVKLAITSQILCMALAGLVASAAEPMNQGEFQELISGNTMIGEWAGRPYKQFFNENRTTIYQEENSPPTNGTWSINEQGQYCSVWPPDPQETCYNVTREGNNLLWESGENMYPATVVDGDQM